MHEQNFEKGVREKLDELSLLPSPPVWDGVAAQIRRRRDKRRIIFWIFPIIGGILLATLLLLGGPKSATPKNSVAQDVPGASTLPGQNRGIRNKKIPISTTEPKVPNTDSNTPKQARTGPKHEHFNPSPQKLAVRENDHKKEGASNRKARALLAEVNPTKNQKDKMSAALNTPTLRKDVAAPPASTDTLTAGDPGELTASPNAATTSNHSDSLAKAKEGIDTLTATPDSTIITPQLKKGKRKTLQFAVVSNFGSSGITTGLFDGLEEKASSDFSGTPIQNSGGSATLPPSAIRRGRYYALGVSAAYPLSARFALSAGLQYQRLSTQLTVGTQGDSTYSTFRMSSTYFNNDRRQRTYTNIYHFVSLPLALQYQVHKKVPFLLSAGFTISRQLSTNALQYNSDNNIYYQDSSLVKRYAAGFVTGLSYNLRLGKRLSLEAGPQFQYHLSPASKPFGNRPQHLYTIGLGSSIKF